MKIFVSHLGYTVEVKQFRKSKCSIPGAVAWSETLGPDRAAVYIDLPVRPRDAALLAHELIHVLQWISEARDIDFVLEQEHFAYLMQWLMNEVMGYKWK